MPSNYFLTRISILHQALQDISPRNSTRSPKAIGHVSNSLCWLCLHNFPDKILQPCKHAVCSSCLDKLSQIQKDQVPISLEVLSLDDTPSSGVPPVSVEDVPIGPDLCPTCGTKFIKVTENPQQQEHLRRRFVNLLAHFR